MQDRTPSDLAIAVKVARQMLDTYAGVDYRDVFALAQAHGAVRESLRIVLRALDEEAGR